MGKYKMIEFAEQQFIGYFHAKEGYGLMELINAMGLTKHEWDLIKPDISQHMTNDEVNEIENYLKN